MTYIILNVTFGYTHTDHTYFHIKYIQGDIDFSYLNRNNWGLGGLRQDAEGEQWEDYQLGVSFGWKISKSIGVFVEGEYTKFWDSKIYNSSIGLNFRL